MSGNEVKYVRDGEGGLVTIVVADGTNDDGDTIPGQIQSVTITTPGKGYTTANIDIVYITLLALFLCWGSLLGLRIISFIKNS